MIIEPSRSDRLLTTLRFAVAEEAEPARPAERPSSRRFSRYRQSTEPAVHMPSLSAAAIELLSRPSRDRPLPHRGRGGGNRSERSLTARLLRTAGRVSREELLARSKDGPRLVAEIDQWLAAHGKQFRPDPVPVSKALAQAIDHIEAILDGTDDHALLSAFVALSELRRSFDASRGAERSTHRRRGQAMPDSV